MEKEPMVAWPLGGEPEVIGMEPVHLRWVDGPVCGHRGAVLEIDGKPVRGVRRLDVIGRAGNLYPRARMAVCLDYKEWTP